MSRVRQFVESSFDYVGLDWTEHVRFDERYLRPTEVDALIGNATACRPGSWVGKRPSAAEELARIMVDADLARLRNGDGPWVDRPAARELGWR